MVECLSGIAAQARPKAMFAFPCRQLQRNPANKNLDARTFGFRNRGKSTFRRAGLVVTYAEFVRSRLVSPPAGSAFKIACRPESGRCP